VNKLDYTCSIADPERELNMLFEFWCYEDDPVIISTISHDDLVLNDTQTIRPSTRIQEFISVDVLPSGFVWEVVVHNNPYCTYGCDIVKRLEISKDDFAKNVDAEDDILSIKCIGLASNYAHYADELNMKVIEGVRCDYSD